MGTDRERSVVGGGTPGGIAAAVRAAREGYDTLLAAYNDHLGGMMDSGLSYADTMTTKERALILEQFFETVRDHYRTAYGPDSEQYEACENDYVFEPHVAEQIFNDLVTAEPWITVLRGYYPTAVERTDRNVRSLLLESFEDDNLLRVDGEVFV